MKRGGAILTIALAWIVSAAALAAAPVQPEPRLRRLDDGGAVANGVVAAIAEDRQGFIWAGTAEGTLRYDGYGFRKFGANGPTTWVNTIVAAADGGVWAGTDRDGLQRIDPEHERFIQYQHDPRQPGSIADGRIAALATEPDGRLWIGFQGNGIDLFDPATARATHFGQAQGLSDERVWSLQRDADGVLWAGTWGGLLRLTPGAKRFESVHSPALDSLLAGHVVTLLHRSGQGPLWIGTQDGQILLFSPASGAVHVADGRRDSPPHILSVAGGDTVWIGRGDGIDVRSVADGHLLQWMRRDVHKPWGLGGDEVRAILRDRSGSLWVGSYGGGLQYAPAVSAGLWVRRPDADDSSVLAEADVRSILARGPDEIWLGLGRRGIAILDAGLNVRASITPENTPGMQRNPVLSFAANAQGDVFAGSVGRVYRFDAARHLRATYAVEGGRARCLRVDSAGWLWVGGQDGVLGLAPGASQLVHAEADGAGQVAGSIDAIYEDPGVGLWAGGALGLFLRRPGASRWSVLQMEVDGQTRNLAVTGMLRDRQGRLWVDTTAGLTRVVKVEGTRVLVTRAPGGAGQANRAFGANLMEDRRGRIWTQRGIFDPAAGSVYWLGREDGVDFGIPWFRSHAKLDDGRLLVGGAAGMLVIDPAIFAPWSYQPPLALTGLHVDGANVPVRSGPLRLEPPARQFSVEFAALDFSEPQSNRYQYWLDPYDKDWVEPAPGSRLATYGNLAPGHYTLHIRGSNRIGAWSPYMLDLPLDIVPAWWQTWQVRTALGAGVLGGVWLLLWWRMRGMQARQRVLEQRLRSHSAERDAQSDALQQLVALGHALHGQRTPLAIAERVLRRLPELLPADAIGIALADSGNGQAAWLAYAIDGQTAPGPDCQAWLAALAGNEGWLVGGPPPVLAASAAAALGDPAAPSGVLLVQSRQADAYGEAQLHLLRLAAAGISLALGASGAVI